MNAVSIYTLRDLMALLAKLSAIGRPPPAAARPARRGDRGNRR